MHPLQQQLMSAFDAVMGPLRNQGWWLDFQCCEDGSAIICANYPLLRNRLFTVKRLVPAAPAVYQRWFSQCAYLLGRVSAKSTAQNILLLKESQQEDTKSECEQPSIPGVHN